MDTLFTVETAAQELTISLHFKAESVDCGKSFAVDTVRPDMGLCFAVKVRSVSCAYTLCAADGGISLTVTSSSYNVPTAVKRQTRKTPKNAVPVCMLRPPKSMVRRISVLRL